MLKFKQSIYFLFDALRINDLFIFLQRKKALIVCYHGVCDDHFDLLKGYEERHMSQALFKRQMLYLKAKGYRFVTLTELLSRIHKKQDIGKLVVITFDDGFQNVIDHAYPIMKELDVKGCVYVISGLVNSGKILWTDLVESVVRNSKSSEFVFQFKNQDLVYRLETKSLLNKAMLDIKAKMKSLTDQELKEHLKQFESKPTGEIPKEFHLADWQALRTLDRNILEVGSHTRTHPNCTKLSSLRVIAEELRRSKEDIEQHLGYSVEHFCYPGGFFNEDVIADLKSYGYHSATTAIPGYISPASDPFKLERIFAEADFLLFKAQVTGSYFFLSALWSGLTDFCNTKVKY